MTKYQKMASAGLGSSAGGRHEVSPEQLILTPKRCKSLAEASNERAGTIDEKIYQRQLQKGELADAMQHGGGGGAAGGKAKEGRFTREELRQLFQLNGATASDTRDLLQNAGAQWQVRGFPAEPDVLSKCALESCCTACHTMCIVHQAS